MCVTWAELISLCRTEIVRVFTARSWNAKPHWLTKTGTDWSSVCLSVLHKQRKLAPNWHSKYFDAKLMSLYCLICSYTHITFFLFASWSLFIVFVTSMTDRYWPSVIIRQRSPRVLHDVKLVPCTSWLLVTNELCILFAVEVALPI